jgi:RNA polymerase sigma-70 factor (ECF subfamily)
MINLALAGHEERMVTSSVPLPAFVGAAGMPVPSAALPSASPVDATAHLQRLFQQNVDFVWRSARRLGLSEAEAEDATQQVFVVASRRLADIPANRERAFLFGTAVHVVANVRRGLRRRREEFAELDVVDARLRPDELLDRARARQVADRILDAMDIELRTVFTLFELEEMSMAEIADLLGVPHGTVASRLRRAREQFQKQVGRLRAGRQP